jgi:cytoskeletal protein CcmA (bactofilin family)
METVEASDISAPFESWLNSLTAEGMSLEGQLPVETEVPIPELMPRRDETPLPSVTQAEPAIGFELKFKGTLHIEGYFTGKVRSEHGTLVLDEGGEINTDIAVGIAQINGTVVGNIDARYRIELGSAARVIGDLHTTALIIMPGAIFEGRCFFHEPLEKAGVNQNGHRRRDLASQGNVESSGPDYMRARRGKANGTKARAARKPDWRRS